MRFEFTGTDRNACVTDGMKAYAEKKLRKLNKHLPEDAVVYVTVRVNHNTKRVEVTIPVYGHMVRVEVSNKDLYVAIDLAEVKVERQLRKLKNQMIAKEHGHPNSYATFDKTAVEKEDNFGIQIKKKKQFEMKPMFPEDACLEMELTSHDFYMFLNAATMQVAVVYKRGDNTYGLLEQELV